MNLVLEGAYVAYFFSAALATALALLVIAAPGIAPWGYRVTVATAAFGLVGLVARTVVSGHLPLFGTFENTWTSSWFLMAGSVLAPALWPHLPALWRWAAPWTMVLLVYGTRFRKEPVALTISEQSLVVDVHVLFAWLAFTCLLCVTTISIARVVKRSPLSMSVEEAGLLHDRLLMVGFLAYTVMMCLGAYYLWVLFAVVWKWDIVGSVALLAWLLYAMLIHGRLFYRWEGVWYDAAIVAILPVLLASYWVWSVFPATYHFFDIPLIRPY